MEHPDPARPSPPAKDTRETLIHLLRARARRARFMSEVYAALGKKEIRTAEIDKVIAELEAHGTVMLRDHFCADPHLAGVDLRVVTLVEADQGTDPQLAAIRRIDETWNKWLNEYLAHHRCG